jgi:hypothetical protein
MVLGNFRPFMTAKWPFWHNFPNSGNAFKLVPSIKVKKLSPYVFRAIFYSAIPIAVAK